MRIGFIGVGNMGGPMAANLLAAGEQVIAYDAVPAALTAAAHTGAEAADSAAAAVRDVEMLITMLPAGEQVREVYCGDGGVIAAASPVIWPDTRTASGILENTALRARSGKDLRSSE